MLGSIITHQTSPSVSEKLARRAWTFILRISAAGVWDAVFPLLNQPDPRHLSDYARHSC